MNYFDWRKGNAVALDGATHPKNESLSEHLKHCDAKKACPFLRSEKKIESSDILLKGNEKKVPTQKDLFDSYEKSGITEELKELIVAFHHAVCYGMVETKRMPIEAFSEIGDGTIPMWMMGAYYIAANNGDDDKYAEKVLLDFAKASGKIFDKPYEMLKEKYGKSIGKGLESNGVFKDGNTVVKNSWLSLGALDMGVLQKIERIILGNKYYPETKYRVDGLGLVKGEVTFLLRQPFVDFKGSLPLTDEEIDEWAAERGFFIRERWTANYATEGNDLASLDMHNQNVVRSVDGQIVCIDPCVIPNVYAIGIRGFYDYDNPPKKFE